MTNHISDYFSPADSELSALVKDALKSYREWNASEDALEETIVEDEYARFGATVRTGTSSLQGWLNERMADFDYSDEDLVIR